MITISTSQLAQFDKLAETSFVQRLETFLVEHHAEATARIAPHELRQCVVYSIERARSHGFSWEATLTAFAVMMFEIGPAFDLHPAFARALAIRLPDEVERIKAVYSNTTDEDWDDARARHEATIRGAAS
jgi:hypothetical protein